MANTLDENGLTVYTQAELITKFETGMKTIYGNDINLDPDSPDGQMMMIFIQIVLDNLDLMTEIYNSMDPDKAIGVTLDHRIAYNGIQRQAGTFTVTPITITVSKALTLYGLDQDVEDIYTVADNAGNEWQLMSTSSPGAAGSFIYNFQSALSGERSTLLNTITVPVTIILGVTAINNPSTYLSLGIDEESDKDARVRRQKSVSISSQGYHDSLKAALLNTTGVSDVFVYENFTGATDGDGIPSHSIWVIVSGSASDEDIATVIYKKRNSGCGMKGSQSYTITQKDLSLFVVNWDEVEAEDLFIEATLTSLDGVTLPDITTIRDGLPGIFVPGVYEQVNINDLATAIQSLDQNSLVTDHGFDYDSAGPFVNTLQPTAKNKQFAVTTPNIILLPMQISPLAPAVGIGLDETFTAIGGFGAIIYSVEVDNSGGASIIAGTGVYTAGSGAGTDTIRATDSLGNFIETTAVVS